MWFLSLFLYRYDFFFLRLLSGFFLWFSYFESDMPKYSSFLAFILQGVLWASWICGSVSHINLGKFSVVIVSNISSVPFFSLWYSHYAYVTLFVLIVILQSLDILFVFFNLCSLCFLVLKDSVDIAFSSKILFSAMSSLLISLSKVVFVSFPIFSQHLESALPRLVFTSLASVSMGTHRAEENPSHKIFDLPEPHCSYFIWG